VDTQLKAERDAQRGSGAQHDEPQERLDSKAAAASMSSGDDSMGNLARGDASSDWG
ncbi:unnamed protein product, partial [Amoebophrya sp. A25]